MAFAQDVFARLIALAGSAGLKKEIRIDELRVMMLDALTLRGIGSEDADFIVDDFLDAELEGHKTPRRLQIP